MHTLEALKNDIPLTLAISAHGGTSLIPEKRGNQEIADYANTVAKDYEHLSAQARESTRAEFETAFTYYREGYRRRTVAWLGSRSRCMSTMITGGSNYPVRRQEKRNRWADNKLSALIEFRKDQLSRMGKILHPELAPILASDTDAVPRIQTKLETLKALQEKMRACNAAIRKHKNGGEAAQVAALVALGINEGRARDLLRPDFCGRIGFADYQLTNNNANIRRLEQRETKITRQQAMPDVSKEGPNGRMEVVPAENRVRLFFPGKPSYEVRTTLKSRGFRWTPTLGCWQAYFNSSSMEFANSFIKGGENNG